MKKRGERESVVADAGSCRAGSPADGSPAPSAAETPALSAAAGDSAPTDTRESRAAAGGGFEFFRIPAGRFIQREIRRRPLLRGLISPRPWPAASETPARHRAAPTTGPGSIVSWHVDVPHRGAFPLITHMRIIIHKDIDQGENCCRIPSRRVDVHPAAVVTAG